MRELGFGEEHAADSNAVAAAGEDAVAIPHLEGVHEPRVVEFRVGAHDARRDPGEVPASFPLASAGLDHTLEVAVERDTIRGVPHQAAQALRDVKLIEEQHATLWRR